MRHAKKLKCKTKRVPVKFGDYFTCDHVSMARGFTIRGVGGVEVVYLRKVDFLKVGECEIAEFEIEVGGMDYGFEINGILGMDFLIEANAIINLQEMRLDFVD